MSARSSFDPWYLALPSRIPVGGGVPRYFYSYRETSQSSVYYLSASVDTDGSLLEEEVVVDLSSSYQVLLLRTQVPV